MIKTIWHYRILLASSALLAQLVMAAETPNEHDTRGDHITAQINTEQTLLDDRVRITVSEQQQVAAGVQVQRVVRKKLQHRIRTVGSITTDQTREAHVHTRVNGWIEKIHVDYVGKAVKQGEPLFDLYSPDLVSTQEEYIAARDQGIAGKEVADAALARLRLWGVGKQELQTLKVAKVAKRALTFYAPDSGVVVRKASILGMYVTPETELYYVADIAKVWLLLTLYESDLPLVSVGDMVAVSLPYDRAKRYEGAISYVYPEIDPQTRTAKARVEIDNADQFLRPGMFADAEIEKQLPEQLVIPDDAVLDTGLRNIVFVKTSSKEFVPREVKVGQRVGDWVMILAGLSEGESVVVSASFLIDAESRLQAALRKGKPIDIGHGDHGNKPGSGSQGKE